MPQPDVAGKRVVVTGATGYIGRRLVNAALAAGFDVVALVRDEIQARQQLPAGVTVRSWTLADTKPRHVEGATAVAHLAAFIPPNLVDPAHARRCVDDNALGTLGLLEAARAGGVRQFIYASSGQVYAKLDRPAQETDPVDAGRRAPYYLGSKLLGEVYCQHAQARGDMSVAILRIGSVYGPGMASRATLRKFIEDARAGRTIRIADGGRYGADFVFVDDVVAAIISALTRQVSGTFNIASGVRTTIAELATTITSRLGGKVELDPRGAPTPGAEGFSALDIGKARRELGYSPSAISTVLDGMISERS